LFSLNLYVLNVTFFKAGELRYAEEPGGKRPLGRSRLRGKIILR
jgi:hypothetical protein